MNVKNLANLALTVWRHANRVVVIVIGLSVVLIGIALIVLPGPAFIVIPAGIAILGTELVWARRLFKRIKQSFREAAITVGLANSPERDDDEGSVDLGPKDGGGSADPSSSNRRTETDRT